MPTPLVECVPNFSEGRDPAVLDAIRTALTSVPGLALLDMHTDPFHHRSVFTIAGTPPVVAEGAFRAMSVALAQIDLQRHRGEHPRIGAADVVPFVPLRDVSLVDCVGLARALGARAGAELQVPVYLYGLAATRPDRVRLPAVRAGGFEGLRDRLGRDSAALPDYGPHHVHPTGGATAIGARPILIAFNVYLRSPNVAVARDIARRIRASNGGLPAVQAAGFTVGEYVQVSMNLLDFTLTSPAAAFAAVAAEATRHGIAIDRSEIVGLAPERAFGEADGRALSLPNLAAHLLEPRLREAGLG